ncbi:MAG: hypothetical protein HDR00_04410 [Lachnospiraceae bacterium]|nr:hypothetical protein [Lachnospiraceae bacterium]
MSSLLEMREGLRNFYSKYEVYLLPLFKFLLALISLLCINTNIGYMSKLSGNIVIVLVVSLMCSFLPMNFIIIISAGFVCGHLYAVSLECAVVAAALFLLMFILYFRFSPKDAVVVLLLPLCFALKVPYVIPIAVGLLCSPISIVSVSCGTVVYYLILYIKTNVQTISTLDTEGAAVAKFRYVIDGILGNKEMLITIVAFAAMIIVVYFIRKMSMDHAWTIAMSVGAVIGVVVLLIGDLAYDTHISIGFLIVGMIVSLLFAKVIQFFAFNVDYSRTEYVQFEDDEYYYYVKAIPKNSVSRAQVKVKKITSVL